MIYFIRRLGLRLMLVYKNQRIIINNVQCWTHPLINAEYLHTSKSKSLSLIIDYWVDATYLEHKPINPNLPLTHKKLWSSTCMLSKWEVADLLTYENYYAWKWMMN